jgi:hypothetical protein
MNNEAGRNVDSSGEEYNIKVDVIGREVSCG